MAEVFGLISKICFGICGVSLVGTVVFYLDLRRMMKKPKTNQEEYVEYKKIVLIQEKRRKPWERK